MLVLIPYTHSTQHGLASSSTPKTVRARNTKFRSLDPTLPITRTMIDVSACLLGTALACHATAPPTRLHLCAPAVQSMPVLQRHFRGTSSRMPCHVFRQWLTRLLLTPRQSDEKRNSVRRHHSHSSVDGMAGMACMAGNCCSRGQNANRRETRTVT